MNRIIQIFFTVTIACIDSMPAPVVTIAPPEMIIYRADNVQITGISERWIDKETNQTRIQVTFTGDWKAGDPNFSMQGVHVSPSVGVIICARDKKELADLAALEARLILFKTDRVNVMIHGGSTNDGKGVTFSPSNLITIEKAK